MEIIIPLPQIVLLKHCNQLMCEWPKLRQLSQGWAKPLYYDTMSAMLTDNINSIHSVLSLMPTWSIGKKIGKEWWRVNPTLLVSSQQALVARWSDAILKDLIENLSILLRLTCMTLSCSVTGLWDGFMPWTGISWATRHSVCIYCVFEGVSALQLLMVP